MNVCACCCAKSSASSRAAPCSASTDDYSARRLRRSRRPCLLGLRHDVVSENLPDEVGMIVTHVLLGVLPELVVVVTFDDQTADAVDALQCRGAQVPAPRAGNAS